MIYPGFDLVTVRRWFSEKSTIGEIYTRRKPDAPLAYILEDVARAEGVKIYGKTAIPAGEYFIRLTYSNRFKMLVPLIYQIEKGPEGSGLFQYITDGIHTWQRILMHPGNDSEDTDGCQLPGLTIADDFVGHSGPKSGPDNGFGRVFDEVTAICAATPGGILKYKVLNEQTDKPHGNPLILTV